MFHKSDLFLSSDEWGGGIYSDGPLGRPILNICIRDLPEDINSSFSNL
jgi:hypothetical protein